MTDIAIQLLILEGVPVLAFVYYLLHKKQMYQLEKGMVEKDDKMKRDDKMIRSERRIINGLFLMLAGAFMMLAPGFSSLVGIKAALSFELILASLIVMCAGLAMLIGEGLIRYRAVPGKEGEPLIEFK